MVPFNLILKVYFTLFSMGPNVSSETSQFGWLISGCIILLYHYYYYCFMKAEHNPLVLEAGVYQKTVL